MKINTAIISVVFCSSLVSTSAFGAPQTAAQTQPAANSGASVPADAPSTPAKIDPAKEAAIRKLLEVQGASTTMNQMFDGMQTNMKQLLASTLPPGDYRETLIDLFYAKFRSKLDVQALLDMAIPVYDKYLSLEDVRGLTEFYSTPLGQKTISVLPKLTIELQTQNMKWGQELGRSAMQEVLTEHPELAQALADATKRAPSPQ